MAEHVINIDKEKCIGCGMCRKDCAAHNIVIENHKARVLSNDCIMCGHCAAVCPKNAVTVSGYDTEPVPMEGEVRLEPEEVLDVIRFRRTIRQFQNKKIPKEVVEQILEAGRLTHTAKNAQDVSFVVLDRKKEELEREAVRTFRKLKVFADWFSPMARRVTIDEHFFFFRAPVVIVILSETKLNGALAAQNMEFVAEANGLGILFSGFFTMAANASPKIKKALEVSKGKKVVTTLVMGYPAVKYQRSAQREKAAVKYL